MIATATKLKSNKMKADKDFTPFPVDDGDEMYPNGFFVLNITKMAEYIQHNLESIDCEDVRVKDYSTGFSTFTEDHLATVDVSKPIILAEISPGRFSVIDGNHRMEQARRLGMEKIPAYKLGPCQHMQFLTTEKGYLAYIEYWNDKLKEQRRN
jgi:hypothetical protein